MRRSRGIREIFDLVRDCDVVLTVDRALADGLNEVRGGPRIGPFATTPRELALGNALPTLGEEVVDEHVTVISIARDRDIDLRRAHSLWREHVDLLRDGGAVDPPGNVGGLTLFEAMRRIGTSPLEQRRVAIVDRHLFTAMDLLMVPDGCVEVTSLSDEPADPMPFKRFPQRRQLVDWVVSGIDGDVMEDVAIVISYRSPYLNLFNSALQRRGVGVSTGGLLRDDIRVRGLLDTLSCSLRLPTLTVGDVRTFDRALGIEVPVGEDHVLLSSLARFDERASEAMGRIERLKDVTWREAIDMMDLPIELTELLGSLDLLDRTIDEGDLEEARYVIDSFPVQIARRSRGVALLDCLSSAFVNRPVCIMVGIDEDWSSGPPDDSRLDIESLQRVERERFVTLIQQGEVTERLVIDSDEVGEVRPCHHLCAEEDVTSFSELDPMDMDFPTTMAGAPVAIRDGGGRRVELMSASSMNRYLTCPRMYMLESLVPGDGTPALLKGNVLHEYLGVRAHEGRVERDREAILGPMIGTMSRLVPDTSLDLMRTDLILGMTSIDGYLDDIGVIEPYKGDVCVRENSLMTSLGIEMRPGITELGFEDEVLGIRGSIDLYVRKGHIVDLKTGRERGLGDIAVGCIPSLIDGSVDLQPTMYLLWHRSVHGREVAHMDLFYCMYDRKAYVTGRKGRMGVTRRTTYIPRTLQGFLSTREGWDKVCEGRTDNGSLVAAGVDSIASIVREHGCESIRRGMVLEDDPMVKALRAEWPEYCDEILGAAIEMRSARKRGEVLVFDDDLDDLEALVQRTIADIEGCWRDGFPARPISRGSCARCPHRDLCTEERT